jgi:hypothetical protein
MQMKKQSSHLKKQNKVLQMLKLLGLATTAPFRTMKV